MASLSAHLREPGGHGRLPFYPACPVCCDERLAGALPADPIVSRRSQAVLASGVLAFSLVAPPSVLASEGDQDQRGTADPAALAAPVGADDDAPQGSDELPADPESPDLPDPDDDATLEPDPTESSAPASVPAP